MVKIAIYAIALNEEQFVERWVKNVQDADVIVVADTGSTDKTKEILKKHNAVVHDIVVKPWRFDVARNMALDLIPKDIDICVSVDMDEILTPGWRKALEKVWVKGETTRVEYPYIWSWKADGTPDVQFYQRKIISRHGYRWKHPVHEIEYAVEIEEKLVRCDGFTLQHFPDNSKSRSHYYPLLELACKEDPEDDRNSHYLGREYTFLGEWKKAIKELKRHLSLKKAVWKPERAKSMCLLSKSYMAIGEPEKAKEWLVRASLEDPYSREPLMGLVRLFYNNDWLSCYYCAKQALKIETRRLHYISNGDNWGSLPCDYIACAAFQLGFKDEAYVYAKIALSLEPENKRLQQNVKLLDKSADWDYLYSPQVE